MSMPEVLDGLPRRMADWAANRSLAPTSVTGISLALGLCAAGWFSAGTRPDNIRGALALLLGYLAWRAARWLASAAGAPAGNAADGAGTLAELAGALSDYAVFAGLAVGGYEAHWSGTWELAAAVVIAMAVRRTAVACGGHIAAPAGDGNPLGSVLRGFLSYSAGGRVAVVVIVAPIWGAHATLLILLEWGIIAAAYVVTGHGPGRVVVEDAGRPLRPAVAAAVGGSPGVAGSARAELSARLEPSAGTERPRGGGADARAPANTELSARPEFSARVDSPDVMDMSGGADPRVPAEAAGRVDSPAPADTDPTSVLDSPLADSLSRADSQMPVDSRQGLDSAVRAHSQAPVDSPAPAGSAGLSASAALTRLASGGGQSETPLALAAPAATTMTLELMIHRETDERRESRPRTVLEPKALATIVAYRDDGAAAVWLSRVVRGQFVPLPPAVAGLAATSFLAWLGMRNLPGVLLLTPLIVMLLAAFGSGHPHSGRLDWLVPAVLMAGQLVYVAAIGFSFGVWAPLTFTLCALIAMRYIALTARDRKGPGPLGRPGETRLGWEGRMLVVGLGAMVGVPVVAYVALSAYVAVLVCGRVRTSVPAVRAAEQR
jgi:hypothetical protein